MSQEGAGFSLDVSQPSIGGQSEVTQVETGCKVDAIVQPPKLENSLEVTMANKVPSPQTGGNSEPYKFIYDPLTGSKHLTNSSVGKNLLKNYVKMFNLINN